MNNSTDKIDIKKYQFYKELTYLTFVQEIWLFGSRVHGDHQMRADIDLAIYCPQANSKDWLTILDIIDELMTYHTHTVVAPLLLFPANPNRQQ